MTHDYISLARRVLSGYTPRPLDQPAPRDAAVLVLLYRLVGVDHVLLTRRTDTVEHHKGQISFPGGGRDHPDEDLAFTALRETWEEVGIEPEHVELIGRLDDHLTVSNFRVAPFVGVLTRAPYPFAPNPIEVAEVIEAPVQHLLDPANTRYETWIRDDGHLMTGPAYYYNGHRIWGATARMLESFFALLKHAP